MRHGSDARRRTLTLRTIALLAFAAPCAAWGRERDAALRERVREHVRKADEIAAQVKVPDFEPGKDWFNSPPLAFERELRGKVVVLDFWTYCCINCIHVLPDLAYLEEKYAAYPVAFVGVHSAKFDNEKMSDNIRQAVLRYEISHPVVNDDAMALWRALGVDSWPTVAVVGPRGNLLALVKGEGQREVLDALIAAALEFYPAGAFRHEPLPRALERERAARTSPLRFAGKLAVESRRRLLFISDSNHNRVVVTDLDGKFVESIGSGRRGLCDGPYTEARFNRPQGLAADGDFLWVADAENHALRRVDLEAKVVSTVAGNGTQGLDREGGGSGREQLLSTPWDVVVDGDSVYIAMAGTHQIWVHDKTTGTTSRYSGTGREENRNHTERLQAAWAQPSGLSIGGGKLWVADSESSTVRGLDLATGATATIVGGDDSEPRDLFAFGDVDGEGDSARLQHPLGVLWLEARQQVIVADTYNHRLKLVDPEKRGVRRWVGSGEPGWKDATGLDAQFSEPSGLALAPDGKRIYVADTNNHAVRSVDLESLAVTTLDLRGVPPPLPPFAPRTLRLAELPGTPVVQVEGLRLAPGAPGKLVLKLALPPKHHYSPDAGSRWQILAEDAAAAPAPVEVEEAKASGSLENAGGDGEISIPVRGGKAGARGVVRVEALAYYCAGEGPCKVGAVLFELPVEVTTGAGGAARARDSARLEHTFGEEPPAFGEILRKP